jgi:hypothetical protein
MPDGHSNHPLKRPYENSFTRREIFKATTAATFAGGVSTGYREALGTAAESQS